MVGDYNSYSQEDPIKVLTDAGYTDVEAHFAAETGKQKYSYSFDGLSGSLDHVFVNTDALKRTTGADTWNINAGESIALNFSRYNYHGSLFWDPTTPYAASDHDPVVVGFKDAAPADTATLNLININDFHGRIDSNTVKFAGTVEQLRAAGGEDNTLFLAAGDNVSASLFASAVADDKPTIDVLNALGMNASAVGNHEFDKGYDDLVNRIMAPYDATTNPNGGAMWKYLGANVYQHGTTTPALPEYAIFTVDGLKVGVIGAVTAETPALVSPGGITQIDIGDPVTAVNRVADQLTDGNEANGEADVLIAEYHEGASEGTPDGATFDEELAAGGPFAEIVNQTSPKVSVLFTGHTHKEYSWDAPVPGEPGVTRPVLQTGDYGENVGNVKLTVDKDTKKVVSYTATNVPRTTVDDATLVSTYPRVAQVKTIVDAALANAAAVGNQSVGKVTADITTAYTGGSYTGPGNTYVLPAGSDPKTGRDDRSKESTIGNTVADALLDTLAPADRGGAEIGVVNPGGLRDELFYAPDGTITYAEANSVLPFVNNLWTTTLTGAQVKTMLEEQWQRDAAGNVPSRPYLQLGLSKNVTYTYDSTRPEGDRITSVTVNGQPLDPAKGYRIGTFSFLTTGGDNFRVVAQGTDARDSGLIDRDGWIAYLQAHNPISPDFAKHAVEVQGNPASISSGAAVSFSVKGLNLTSLGSPANSTLAVKLGSTTLGTAAVTNGAASVSVTIPANTPAGATALTLVASPSGTTVTVPITITGPVQTGPTIKSVSVADGDVVSGTKTFQVKLAGKAADVSYTYIELNKGGVWVTDNTTPAAIALGSTNSGLNPKLVVDTTTLLDGSYGLKVDAVGKNGKTTEKDDQLHHQERPGAGLRQACGRIDGGGHDHHFGEGGQ